MNLAMLKVTPQCLRGTGRKLSAVVLVIVAAFFPAIHCSLGRLGIKFHAVLDATALVGEPCLDLSYLAPLMQKRLKGF